MRPCIRAAVLVQNTVPALTDHWRHVVYACYQPRSFAGEEDLRLKAQAWEEYRVTTHWPARNVHLFPKSQPGKGTCTVGSLKANGLTCRLSSPALGNFQRLSKCTDTQNAGTAYSHKWYVTLQIMGRHATPGHHPNASNARSLTLAAVK